MYAVKATFSQRVVDGGLMITAYSGVAPAFADAVGNHSSRGGASASATVSDAGPIQIDAHAPPAPGAPLLAGASDSGIAGDGITSAKQPTLTGSASASFATIKLFEGDTLLATGRTPLAIRLRSPPRCAGTPPRYRCHAR